MRFLKNVFAICVFCCALALCHQSALAQDMRQYSPEERFAQTAKNTLFVEGLGNGGLYSFNFDRRLAPTWNVRLGFSNYRADAALANVFSGAASLVVIPLIASYLYNFPESNSYLELGGGISSLFATVSVTTVVPASATAYTPIPTFVIMYRIMPSEGGFSLRAGLTPLILPNFFLPILPWLGVSLGWTFGGF
ncbi:MAG: hypothetical protein ACOVSW_03985 [Candidatus Kapaibacteriota bacterium]|jgi:hypothetical protein